MDTTQKKKSSLLSLGMALSIFTNANAKVKELISSLLSRLGTIRKVEMDQVVNCLVELCYDETNLEPSVFLLELLCQSSPKSFTRHLSTLQPFIELSVNIILFRMGKKQTAEFQH